MFYVIFPVTFLLVTTMIHVNNSVFSNITADGYCRSEGIVVLFLQKKSEAKRTYCSLVNTRTNSNGHTDQGEFLRRRAG